MGGVLCLRPSGSAAVLSELSQGCIETGETSEPSASPPDRQRQQFGISVDLGFLVENVFGLTQEKTVSNT